MESAGTTIAQRKASLMPTTVKASQPTLPNIYPPAQSAIQRTVTLDNIQGYKKVL